MRPGEVSSKPYEDATQLRSLICELFGARDPQRLVLAPGILIGLQILFASLGARRIALTYGEYYSQIHFPALSTETFSAESLVREVEESKPDAVIASVVTWRGKVLPVAKLFREIRETLGPHAPLLIADYSHAGAAGFPPMDDLDADIVCGDPAKWILPQQSVSRVAFLSFRSDNLFATAKRAFGPFFLAAPEQGNQLFARWIAPRDVRSMLEGITEERLDRRTLVERHSENTRLASKLASELRIEGALESSIIWSNEEMNQTLPSWLVESGLVWNPPTGGTRILCRAEAAPYRSPFR